MHELHEAASDPVMMRIDHSSMQIKLMLLIMLILEIMTFTKIMVC